MKSYYNNSQEFSHLLAQAADAPGSREANIGNYTANFRLDLTVWQVIINTLNWLLWISVGLGVLFIVIGAIQFMTSMGDKEKQRVATETLKYSIIGTFLVLGFSTAVNLFVQMFF